MDEENIKIQLKKEKKKIWNRRKYVENSTEIKKNLIIKRQLSGEEVKVSTLLKYNLAIPEVAVVVPVKKKTNSKKYPLILIEEIFKSNTWLKNKGNLFLAHKRNISIFRRVLELMGYPLDTHSSMPCVLAPFKSDENKMKMKFGIDNMVSKRDTTQLISTTTHKTFYGIINTLIKTDNNHHQGTIQYFFSKSDKSIFNRWMMDSIKNSAEYQRINSTYSSLKLDYDDLLLKYNEFKPIDDEDRYYKYIISLYLFLPPQRTNWKNVKVVDEEGESGNNYYIPNTKTLIIGDFKNDISIKNNNQVFNKVEISLSDGCINSLSDIFKPELIIEQIENMNYKTGDYLLYHLKKNRNEPTNSDFFKIASKRIFGEVEYKSILKMDGEEPVFVSKKGIIDTTDLRKAVITKLYRQPSFSIKKRDILAKYMLHSPQVAQTVYNNISWSVL